MATKEVLQNIFYFTNNVLRAAYFDRDWEKNSLLKAFQWAKYCEKVFHEAVAKSLSIELEKYLQDLTLKIPNCVVPCLNLCFLRDATHQLTLVVFFTCIISLILLVILPFSFFYIHQYSETDKVK
ncbi:uncharacterized protein LOC111089706 [Limulus polyphemus]|uniref:Uncharacterized protein LOC111089706 n=1 Tax=Limulus polyphemus TaxID=6850 RepID=A0ABM1TR66_LIMPO|nr:uncharacterized protein LOC111089706 [Limulus polyphemus]